MTKPVYVDKEVLRATADALTTLAEEMPGVLSAALQSPPATTQKRSIAFRISSCIRAGLPLRGRYSKVSRWSWTTSSVLASTSSRYLSGTSRLAVKGTTPGSECW